MHAKKIILLIFIILSLGFTNSHSERGCGCLPVTNFQKSGESSGSISLTWSSSQGATGYKIWYTRLEDQYASNYFYPSGTTFSLTALPTGHYIFYLTALCAETSSEWVGVEDVIQF